MEARTDINIAPGITGYANYALGRVEFKNPVTGGFVTEAEHLSDTNWFAAPMDQVHTLTAGGTYRHERSGAWTGLSIEYGSGTPIGHGGGHHDDGHGEAHQAGAADGVAASRMPAHFTANATVAVDLLREANRRPRLTLRVDVENVANSMFIIARESEFSAGQYAKPRQLSLTARLQF